MENSPQTPKVERIFTLLEANALIPHLTGCLQEIARLRVALMEIVESKSELAGGNGNPLADIEQTQRDIITVANIADRIKHLLDAIDQTGAILKDVDMGIVDFLYMLEGRKVYLCWHLGESTIRFWHEITEEETKRKPLK